MHNITTLASAPFSAAHSPPEPTSFHPIVRNEANLNITQLTNVSNSGNFQELWKLQSSFSEDIYTLGPQESRKVPLDPPTSKLELGWGTSQGKVRGGVDFQSESKLAMR